MSRVLYRGRRHFLRGACGMTLAIPLLPSLLPRGARAGGTAPARRFVAFASKHSGLRPGEFFPTSDTLTESMNYAGHTIRRGDLQLQVIDGQAHLSPGLFADASLLTPERAATMNMLLGIDYPIWTNHGNGYILGNYADGSEFNEYVGPNMSTVDQLIAHSDSVYGDAAFNRRYLNMGSRLSFDSSFSWQGADPSDPTSVASHTPLDNATQDLFDELLVGFVDDPDGMPSGPTPAELQHERVVDAVFEHYRALRYGAHGDASRIGRDDQLRLERHMDRVSELQDQLDGGPGGTTAACGQTPRPSINVGDTHPGVRANNNDLAAAREAQRLLNDVIVAGFVCDATRVASIGSRHIWHTGYTEYGGTGPNSFHDGCAHQTGSSMDARQDMMESFRNWFSAGMLDLMVKLDVPDIDGTTILDNTLMISNCQSGARDHYQDAMPIITAGGAGGRMMTGSFCDYRNNGEKGLLMNQFFASAMLAMGMGPEEFETNGNPGYGPMQGTYQGSTASVASEMLPFL